MNNKLDELLKRIQSDEYKLDDLVGRTDNYANDTLRARNLEEKALGKLMLEQYKGKVPNTPDADFLEGLREQFLPDVKSKIELGDIPGAGGLYSPSRDLIKVSPNQSLENITSALAHEGLHSRDLKAKDYGDVYDLTSGSSVNKSLRQIAPDLISESGLVKKPADLLAKIKGTDIDEIKEALLKGHHGLKRGATAAKANLPRLIKGLPLLGAGAAMLMNPEDASAAVPFLNEAEDVGESREEEGVMLAEDKARKDYKKSPAKLDRLQKLLNRR